MGKAPRAQLSQNVRRRTSTIFKCGSCDIRIYTLYGETDFPFAAPYRIKYHRCFSLIAKPNDDVICNNCQRKLGRKLQYGSSTYAELYDVIAVSDNSDDDDDDSD